MQASNIIKNIFDYYYLVILRGHENIYGEGRFFTFHVSSIMSLTLTANILSFFALFNRHTFFQYGIWIGISFFIAGTTFFVTIDAIYNKKRRKRLVEQYEDESFESRSRGAGWVWFYEIFSILFLIWALSRLELPHTSYV